jgi:N-glycosylase/DNA lyase
VNKLFFEINRLRNSTLKQEVDKRLTQFRTNEDWFSELCFCLLTANTSAELGIKVQNELGYDGFTIFKDEEELAKRLKKAKYRFYNKRAHYISLANKYKDIKSIIEKKVGKREWLVKNIKGLGYKESSHFLRNVGYFDYAILDKHVLNLLKENLLLEKIPTMNRVKYEEIEKILDKLAKKLEMSQGELDLYLWFMKTGKVLK